MIRIELQIPPSANMAYRNVPGRGRVLTEKAKAWYAGAEVAAWSARKNRITMPYHFRIFLPKLMRGDVDGRLKLALDLLVKTGLTPDDKHAQSTLPIRSDMVRAGYCVIEAERSTSFFPTEWLERWTS